MASYQGKRFSRGDDEPRRRRRHAAASPREATRGGAASRWSPATRIDARRPSKQSGYPVLSRGGVAPVHAPSSRGARTAHGDGRQPIRRHRGRRIVSAVLLLVGIGLALTAAGIFISAQLGYKEAEDSYGKLSKYATISDGKADGAPKVDFDQLNKINPEIVGWISIPGTNINYPVAQAKDNKKYLTTLFDGKKNSSGSIFLDMACTAPGMVDEQTSLYGHHMNNQSMFYQVNATTDQARFDKIKTAYYVTRDGTYKLTPLMTAVVDDSYVNARTPNFSGETSLTSYLSDLLKHARAKASDAEKRSASAKKVISLITCSSEIPTNDRTVMVLTPDQTDS